MTPTSEDLTEALRLLKDGGRADFSIDYLRRKLMVGYQSAWEIMHALEAAGKVCKTDGKVWRWKIAP